MEERKEIITLVDEDGSKLEFLALDYFDVDEVEYAVLLPFDGKFDDDNEILIDDEDVVKGDENGLEDDSEENGLEEEVYDANGDAIIFRVEKTEDGETMLHVIEDDEEWNKVAEIASERLFYEEKNRWEEGKS
ncbi:MAG TPA: DUF1292 domain-containing protein [Firmicutes bacterium]|nr:DUF1292 domain-containing protein [Bacillota bacterium]